MDTEMLATLRTPATAAPACPGVPAEGQEAATAPAHADGCCERHRAAHAAPLLEWLRAGNSLGYHAPFGDWWLYAVDHEPGKARMLDRESFGATLCRWLRDDGQIVQVDADGWAKIIFYDIPRATPATVAGESAA